MSKAAELAKMGEVLTNNQIGGRRNIVINGAMQIAQRATSSTGIGSAAGYFTCDRWKIHTAGTTAGRLTMAQSTDTPSGFANSVKLTCTTADTSIAAGEQLQLRTTFEGQDLQQLKKGTSDAEKLTVSFYVKGNASATYTCELYDADNTRHNGQEFSVTTSWTRVVLTYDGDTSGALDNDNGGSLNLTFILHAGSNLTGGTFSSNTWNTTTNQRVGDNQTSFFDSTDRTFFITGIQLEVGSAATPFEHRSFGEELTLCQRYYEVIFNGTFSTSDFSSYHPWVGMAQGSKSDQINYMPQFRVLKRVAGGTAINTTVSNGYEMYTYTTTKTSNTLGNSSNNMERENGLWWLGGSVTGVTEQSAWALRLKSTDCFLAIDCEL